MSQEPPLYVVYKNVANEVKAYAIVVKRAYSKYYYVLDVTDDCRKTFIQTSVLETADSFERAEQRAKILQADYLVRNPRERTKTNGMRGVSRQRRKQAGQIEVCFTGFKEDEKKKLTQYAEEKGCLVRSSVTRYLNVLVCGETKGWLKVEKATDQGAGIVFGRAGFDAFLATGATSE